ncbi:MAG TPA: alpha/beta hydrolase family protein [Leptospiraceae bacterium]|nr:alpha/beta hydrolase family protein [Leptospiraceae bacterium]HMW07679.1 alpha/beta hydrolase family protein [Leptospiraceae bacterium]HMX33813.1 alpha/beta hydrolase family protein [Leptospiraceae bacterium]HMY33307.1 alpha/beta hydrolase family protein [Leptospiraceae bacterium]HNA08549.1 alpha/beta hydrolase family protein [Leptospiraceae bacterium]
MNSLLDTLYSTVVNRDLFFQSGWGDKHGLEYLLSVNPTSIHLRPVKEIDIKWGEIKKEKEYLVQDGEFQSPFEFIYDIKGEKVKVELPEETKTAYIQRILPFDFSLQSPLTIHFAATGDEGYSRRRLMLAIPLAKKGIGSVLLENPYYGKRRPKGQKGVVIRTFTEFLRMSRAATDEGIALLKYFHRAGHRKLGVTGISMGGYVSLTASARSNLEIAVAACIPSHSGSPVYVEGALSKACDWTSLSSPFQNPIDAKHFMRLILDQSDIRSFPKPKRMDAVIIVGAKKDGYIPNYSTQIIKDHWEKAELRWVKAGHVGSFLFCTPDFRKAIEDSFSRLVSNEFYSNPIVTNL